MKLHVDLNCDLGEGFGEYNVGNDSGVMPYITSANVACGFHAGDALTMARTVNLARKNNVFVGAHPGYPDLLGFGRREMNLTLEEIKQYTVYQIGALQGIAREEKIVLQHVKPHGALYNLAVKDEVASRGIVSAVKVFRDDLIVLAPSKSSLAETARSSGLRVAQEFFADRGYNSDGTLVSRKQPGAIINEPQKVVERAVRAVAKGEVVAVDGSVSDVGEVHTICVHGDTPDAVRLAEVLKKGLAKARVEVKPLSQFL